jgi:murein DD-endopeptidase MepM/ murein hydrolase activator NlpD
MNPRIPYRGPGATRRRDGCGTSLFGVSLALILLAALVALGLRMQTTGFDIVTAIGSFLPTTPPSKLPTAVPVPSPSPMATLATAEPFEITPTATATPVPPTPTPTKILTPGVAQFYYTQSGDTLAALAARFGVNPADLRPPAPLHGSTSLEKGQLIIIPQVLGDNLSPGYRIVPDSELIFGGGAAGFDPAQVAAQYGGYLAGYRGFAESITRSGGDVILLTAQNHAINPRLLTALLEYQSGWVTNPQPQGDALTYPLGYVHQYRHELMPQLDWATALLAVGYYGWRAGTLTTLTFPDGSTLRLNPTLNAGTVALQYFFAQVLNRPAWDMAVSMDGFAATYTKLFGDPFSHAVDPLVPPDLTQPPLALPFALGHTWSFTGGPHGAWEHGGARAALDFAPSSSVSGCVQSLEWVTAVAAGKIVRTGQGTVLLDLDGDGRESTGWVILYLHIADDGKVQTGAYVEKGDRIGHPSCEGGVATGTHVHIARKYNGEWIPADALIPFNLGGWVAQPGPEEYAGTLVRDDQVVTACTCSSANTLITAGQ